MSDRWVANASPIITLAKAGRLDLLKAVPGELLVPVAVADELLLGPAGDPARAAILAGWAPTHSPRTIPPTLMEWGLGSGETAVLALCLEHPQSTAVLDDASARTAARALGIKTIGTLGVVVLAKKRGLTASAADVLTDLRRAGLYLDDDIIRTALKTVSERWP